MRTDQPNVLVIMSDQHNADVMGCAGDPVVQTPNLDRLAAEGARLENLYCPAPLCAPSRMSFLTGMHPSATGVLTNDHVPDAGHPTYAHSAGAVGYRPHHVGKMHALGSDLLLGFVDREVGDHGPAYLGLNPPARGELAGTAGPDPVSLVKSGPGRNAYQARDEFAAEAALSYLRRREIDRRSGSEREPFFLTVGLMLPHQPYVARAEDYEIYDGRVPPPRRPAWDSEIDDHPFFRWFRRSFGLMKEVPEEQVTRARVAYWAMVHRMDIIIGSILDQVEAMGESENTLVIYTSDHGDHIGEHGLWWKQSLLDTSAKVPGIVRWPDVIPGGQTVDAVAGLVDLTATIVEAVEGPALPRSNGSSMLGVLTQSGADWKDTAISEYGADEGQGGGGVTWIDRPHYSRMVRRGSFKLIDHGDEPAQLIDLAKDPDETIDLANNPEFKPVLDELMSVSRADWDPAEVAQNSRERRAEQEVLSRWARAIQPAEPYRWTMKAEYNHLDQPISDK